MQIRYRWVLVALIAAGLPLSACGQQPDAPGKIKPAEIERIEGTDLSRLILTAKAAERLDIRTAPVRDEAVLRTRVVGGKVVALPAASTVVVASVSGTISATLADVSAPAPGTYLAAGETVLRLAPTPRKDEEIVDLFDLEAPHDAALLRLHVEPGQFVVSGQPLFEVADLSTVGVRVPIVGDPNRVARDQAVLVRPLSDDEEIAEMTAQPAEAAVVAGFMTTPSVLHYAVANAEHRLVPGQSVRVELPLSGSGTQRRIIPYDAVLYDSRGETWTYTNPEHLVFVRHAISVDYIDGDLAVLSDGPPSGTAVVTVGAIELFGIETGVGK